MKFAMKLASIVIASLLASVVMAENLRFGNCPGPGEFLYAPDSLVVSGVWKYKDVLTPAEYAASDWWPTRDTPPVCQSNEVAVSLGWRKIPAGGGFVVEHLYRVEVLPPPDPSTVEYSVADLTYWAFTHGKLAALVEFLRSNGLYEIYLTTASFKGDNDVLGAVRSGLVRSGVATEAEIEEALAYAVVD